MRNVTSAGAVARIGNGSEMHHRFLPGETALQCLVVGDVALDRPNPGDVDRHAIEDCQIAALPQVFRDVAAEPAHASGNDDFLIPHVSSHLVLIVFSLCRLNGTDFDEASAYISCYMMKLTFVMIET